MPSLAVLTVAASALLGTTAAFASPFSLPGGGQIKTTENSFESTVAAHGDELKGIFQVGLITGPSGVSYTYGSGTYLTGIFNGFILDTVTPLDGTGTNFRLAFTGGSLQYYTSATDPFAGGALTNGSGTQDAAIDIINNGGLELNLTPEVFDGTHTLTIDVFGGAPPFTTFVNAATSKVFLDIIGGAAADLFSKDTFTNTFTLALADGVYSGTANTENCEIAPRWQVCGQNGATLRVIPEPLTLSVFGAGLAGAAALRRRKAKKA
jgi:hypothetical protein